MSVLTDLLNQFLRRRWLKAISKEVDKYNWTVQQLRRQRFVVAELVKRYNELFGDDLQIGKKGGAE